MFGIKSRQEKENKMRIRVADYQEATAKRNDLIAKSIDDRDAAILLEALFMEDGDIYAYYDNDKILIHPLLQLKSIRTGIMIAACLEGAGYLEPLQQKYARGCEISGLNNYMADFKRKYNGYSKIEWYGDFSWRSFYHEHRSIFTNLKRFYINVLLKDNTEMELLEQLYYNMSKTLDIVEKRRDFKLQANYEKWYEALLLTTDAD